MIAFLCSSLSHSAECILVILIVRARRVKHLPASKWREEESFKMFQKRLIFYGWRWRREEEKKAAFLHSTTCHGDHLSMLALLRFRLSEFLYFLCHMHDDVEISGKGIYHKNAAYRDPLFRILSLLHLFYNLLHPSLFSRTCFRDNQNDFSFSRILTNLHCSSQQRRVLDFEKIKK